MTLATDRRFPFAAEFSPSIVDLGWLLDEASASPGDFARLVESIRRRFFSNAATRQPDSTKRLKQQETLSKNVLWGARRYGLFNDAWQLTPLGEELRHLRASDRARRFAQHILTNLRGIDLLRAIRAVQERGERPTKQLIGEELERAGFWRTVNSTYEGKLRLWLREAGVIDDAYTIDDALVLELTGVAIPEAERIADMSAEQRAFMTGAVRVGGADWVLASHAREYARRVLGVRISEPSLAARVIAPLVQGGFLEQDKRDGGRGGKSGWVRVPERFVDADIDGLIESNDFRVSTQLRALLKRSLSQIVSDLTSTSTHVKGLALEALAVRLAQFLGLSPRVWRAQSSSYSGGSEVDLIAEAKRISFTRWQIQCKNTPVLAVDDVAKEHGVAQLVRSNVLMLVTTGRFSGPARLYAREVMMNSNLGVVLIDGSDLKALLGGAGLMRIVDICDRQAEEARKVKDLQLNSVSKESLK